MNYVVAIPSYNRAQKIAATIIIYRKLEKYVNLIKCGGYYYATPLCKKYKSLKKLIERKKIEM